jgi:hypothetical protein
MPGLNDISVGPAGADIVGADNRAIQMAIDALAARGGGTVRILAGEYVLSDAVRLRSNIALLGDRDRTVLRLAPIVWSPLAVDADTGQKEITPRDIRGFREGQGVVCRDKSKPNGMSSVPLTVVRVADGKLYLNDYLNHDWCAEDGGLVVNYVPLLHGFEVENALVDGFTLDARPDRLNGLGLLGSAAMWGGAFYLRRGRNCVIRNVVARGCLGDGIRFGQCEHVTVEDCTAADNSEYGIHPGSHSPWTTVRRCHIQGNGSDGLYLCWGVREGLFEDNVVHHNGRLKKRNGICIGHKDTDNVFLRNHVYENTKHGVHFRIKTEANGAHRNTFRDNIIENNGPIETGAGVWIEGVTHDLVFEHNIIRETRSGAARAQQHAFVVKPGVSRVKLVDNEISGHPGATIVDEARSDDNDFQGLL